MNSLRELQITFQATVLQEDTKLVGVSNNARLKIYYHSIRTKHFQALKKLYPTIYKLVGAAFFGQLSKEYQMVHPSSHWSLSEFGRWLPDFLSSYAPVQHLTYLPEVAQLDWGIQEVLQDGQSRLLIFAFPVLDIWKFCQGAINRKDRLHLESAGQNLLLKLNQFELEIQRIDC
ncbi:MAG: DNA-binding domain-containing protein [Gammaproteobacteria bacterium]